MKTLLRIAALAIFTLSLLTSCTTEQQNFTEPVADQQQKHNRGGKGSIFTESGSNITDVVAQWEEITGQMRYIAMAAGDNAYAYDLNGYIYKWSSAPSGDKALYGRWLAVPNARVRASYNHITLSVSEDGNSIWGLSYDNNYGDGSLKDPAKWDGSKWITITAGYHGYGTGDGTGKNIRKISVGNDDNVWFCNDNGDVYKYVPGGAYPPGAWWKTKFAYTALNFKAHSVAVSPNGKNVWAINHYDMCPYKLINNVWVKMSDSPMEGHITVSNNDDLWAMDYSWKEPVKKHGNNWLVMGDRMRFITISADGKNVWGVSYYSGKIYRFTESTLEPAAPANNPNNKYTAMNRDLMDSTLKCFGKSSWKNYISSFDTEAGKIAIRDLYVGAYDQAITRGTLIKYGSLFVGGIGGTEYNTFVTSMRETALQSMNIQFGITPPPSTQILSTVAQAIQQEITEWRGNEEVALNLHEGVYSLADLRNFLTAENSKIAVANITEQERSLLYEYTNMRWEDETYRMSKNFKDRQYMYLGLNTKAMSYWDRVWYYYDLMDKDPELRSRRSNLNWCVGGGGSYWIKGASFITEGCWRTMQFAYATRYASHPELWPGH